MGYWLAVCFMFSFNGPKAVQLVDLRVGAGQYQKHPFLHLQAEAAAPWHTQTGLGGTEPIVPMPPMRQFLRCRP